MAVSFTMLQTISREPFCPPALKLIKLSARLCGFRGLSLRASFSTSHALSEPSPTHGRCGPVEALVEAIVSVCCSLPLESSFALIVLPRDRAVDAQRSNSEFPMWPSKVIPSRSFCSTSHALSEINTTHGRCGPVDAIVEAIVSAGCSLPLESSFTPIFLPRDRAADARRTNSKFALARAESFYQLQCTRNCPWSIR